ncbi:dihydrofolate reductase family protein [Oleiphilus sp. HI0067]|nr:deaminase [Oleiphilus sp. HI0067]
MGFIATSLDGYIARKDGNLDWLDKANAIVLEGEDCGFVDFISTVDVLVMGSNTYAKVLSFGTWPYEVPVIVLSQRDLSVPNELSDKITISKEAPEDLVQRLSAEGNQRLYIDGASVIQSFLSKGLITDMTITVVPVLIGEGISLFGHTEQDIELEHVSSKAYDFGFTQIKYLVK